MRNAVLYSVMKENKSHISTWNTLLKGDLTALEDLYNQHYISLLNYGMKFTGERELTKDCIFQLFLKLWDSRKKLPALVNVRSYLITCVHNEMLKHIKKTNVPAGNDIYAGSESSYEDYLIEIQHNNELKIKLKSAFQKLSEREKELLHLKFFEDLGYDEISTRCYITKRTAYNIIYGALKTLRQSLVEEFKVAVNPHFILTALKAIIF
ncbi:MAG: sigma-70 family RNA polymerase sigma factor [Agriterribacter sp.]